MIKYKLSSGFCLIILLLLVSCRSEMESILTTSPTFAIATATITPQPTSSSNSLPTTTVTEIVEITPVLTPVPITSIPVSELVTPASISTTPTIVAITLTPLPTLDGKVLETRVAELLEDPMNCEVPCWWGAIPGVTTDIEIKHAIAPYNFTINEYEYEDKGEKFTAMSLGIGYQEERNGFDIRMGYIFSNAILVEVSAYSPSITEILENYGQPDEVWISAENDPRQQPPLVRFAIAYLQEGVGVGYAVHGEFQDAMVRGCFVNEKTGELRLVVPDSATSYKDFSTIYSKETLYLPLEEATDLTMKEFMQLFSDPSQPQCIDTPRGLWEWD